MRLPARSRGRARCPRRRWAARLLVGALAVLAATPLPARAQALPEPTPSETRGLEHMPGVDTLLAAGEAEVALGILEDRLSADPDAVELRWRAARAATLVGMLSPILVEARPWYRRAMAHADSALAREPGHIQARTWSMMSRGRLALWTGPRETAELGQEVWGLAHGLLEDDEDHALAHLTLGVVATEVETMPRPLRFLARVLVGGEALSQATWELAFHHLGRAVALEPGRKMHRLAFARALEGRGLVQESRATAETALALPMTDALSRRHHELLQRFLARLEERHGSG